VATLFDAYPAAVFEFTVRDDDDEGIPDIVSEFLQQQRNDFTVLSESPLPVHEAICSNKTLGVVKLLVDKFPNQLTAVDNEGRLPLHLACKLGKLHIVEYLVGMDQGSLLARDAHQNHPLHYACQFGRCDVVNYLLEVEAVLVSEQNKIGKLPFRLLVESDCDKDDLSYAEAVWRLLVASPDVLPGNP